MKIKYSLLFFILALNSHAETLSGKVLCFGDIRSCTTLTGESWFMISAKKLNFNGINYSDKNLSSGCLELVKKALNENPDTEGVIIAVGLFDACQPYTSSPEASAENISKLIDEIRTIKKDCKIIICAGPNISKEKLTVQWQRKYFFNESTCNFIKELALHYQNIAAKKKAGFVNLVDVVPESEMYDGIDLTQKGKEIIAEAFIQAINKEDIIPEPVQLNLNKEEYIKKGNLMIKKIQRPAEQKSLFLRRIVLIAILFIFTLVLSLILLRLFYH